MGILEFMQFSVAAFVVSLLAVVFMTMAAIAMVTTLTGLAVSVLARVSSMGLTGISSFWSQFLDQALADAYVVDENGLLVPVR